MGIGSSDIVSIIKKYYKQPYVHKSDMLDEMDQFLYGTNYQNSLKKETSLNCLISVKEM